MPTIVTNCSNNYGPYQFPEKLIPFFHEGLINEAYNIGGFSEWKNIDLIKVMFKTVDKILGNPEGTDRFLLLF